MKSSKLKVQSWLMLLVGIVAAGVLGGWLVTKTVKAEEVKAYPPVIQKLIERFNLNKDEVKGVFDEVGKERQQKRQTYIETRLEQAVKDGVITADQKQALLNKETEMQEKNKQLREEMQTWMAQSGIDFEKLIPHRVGLGGRGFRQEHWFGGF